MNTTMYKHKLTDGSYTYSLVFVDGSQHVSIECYDLKSATELQEHIERLACYATVDYVQGVAA